MRRTISQEGFLQRLAPLSPPLHTYLLEEADSGHRDPLVIAHMLA